MYELLLLLLPVAAASGWVSARRSMRRAAKREQVGFDPAYLQGLNYLLNDQPDKAIDLFVSMLEVDTETVETHLALGNLFRRRGEVDRAIRIHQNLIARPALNQSQRSQALLELGLDYMRAGLLDRAENLFIELSNSDQHAVQALSNMLIIYQEEKEWEKCLETAKALESHDLKPHSHEIAHYYCELAELALKSSHRENAKALLKKAHLADRGCVRPTLLQGRIEMDQNDLKSAIKTFQKIARQAPCFLSEVLQDLIQCYTRLGWSQELESYLRQLCQQHQNASVMLTLTDLIHDSKGAEAAIDFLHANLRSAPDLRGMDRLIALNMKKNELVGAESIQVLRDLIAKMLQDKMSYQCGQCGFSATQLYWQCPSCKAWDGIKPSAALC